MVILTYCLFFVKNWYNYVIITTYGAFMKRDLLVKLLGVSPKTVYNYEKENRAIIKLLKQYFNNEDIIEFLESGKISKCENLLNLEEESKRLQEHLIDHAFYSSKQKLKDFFGGNPFGPNKAYTKGAKEILIDVLKKISPKDTSFKIDNAKEKLIDRISEEELKWLSIKNPAKRDLLSHYLKENFSNAEILAMVQKSDEIVEFLDKV